MFWGITLESGKKYTQVLQRSFHLTMAALGFKNVSVEPVSVVVDIDNAQFVLCTLQPGKIPQQPLDLNFTEGEKISFSTEGDGEVHLTGYLTPTPMEYELTSEDDVESSDEEKENENCENENDVGDYEETVRLIKNYATKQEKEKKNSVSEVSWQGVLDVSPEKSDEEKTVPANRKVTNQIAHQKQLHDLKNSNEVVSCPNETKEISEDTDKLPAVKKASPKKKASTKNEKHSIQDIDENVQTVEKTDNLEKQKKLQIDQETETGEKINSKTTGSEDVETTNIELDQNDNKIVECEETNVEPEQASVKDGNDLICNDKERHLAKKSRKSKGNKKESSVNNSKNNKSKNKTNKLDESMDSLEEVQKEKIDTSNDAAMVCDFNNNDEADAKADDDGEKTKNGKLRKKRKQEDKMENSKEKSTKKKRKAKRKAE